MQASETRRWTDSAPERMAIPQECSYNRSQIVSKWPREEKGGGPWIVADGSRGRFDEVIQKLGPTETVERLILKAKYRALFSDRAREAARERLERSADGPA